MKYATELTIASGASESDALEFNDLRHAREIVFYPPSSLSGTVTVEVTDKRSPSASDWNTLQSGGSDVTLTADKATVVTETGFLGLRLATTVAPGSDEVYGVVINEES